MIREEYVTFETAKLLKAAGYPQNFCATRYDSEGNRFLQHTAEYAAPTQAQAMRWLREEKNLTILFEMISPSEAKDYGLNAGSYTVDIYDTCGLHLFGIDDLQPLPTYEAAAEAGIKAACEYLIEEGGATPTYY